ncbi:lytic transglycosylase domain-containing protein [Rhodopila sp.]|uniref:lytic transglycosylase domain-containing protein n=1 Tax=Rhodopila sp. TaxID=2480087 RepID=UPI003D09C5D3
MRVPIRSILSCLACLLTGSVQAQDAAQNPIIALHADRWADAQAAAARFADPVAEKLVLYFRLRAPGAATAADIADFMQRNPDWPAQPMLERRRQEAIALEPDDAAVLAQCAASVPTLANAMLRCAEAMANAGRTADANAMARAAWIDAISGAGAEAAFLRRWSGLATPDDQWARFQRLAWTDPSAAARQLTRLDVAHHTAGEARLAVRRDDPQGEPLVASLPPERRDDPGLMLDRARCFRKTDRTGDAVALWLQSGTQAQRAAPGHLAEFWAERNELARKLLHDGDMQDAYAIVAAHGQTAGEPLVDAEFLAGFIALRLLHDPAKAAPHFQALAAASPAAITQGRAHYWLARTAAAAGADAEPEYQKAAAWPTTFYGQLAALALGSSPAARIRALRDPAWTEDTALAFTGHEVLRAAAWLIAWGDNQRARVFLRRMDELAPIPAERALTAAFSLQVGLPDSAVAVARRMGRDGLALPRMGWPEPFKPPTPPDAGFSLGIMRQESSFDIGALSSSGARGLMQLMPPTAASEARQLGIPVSISALTVDASNNMRLGTAYLQEVLTRFDGSLPLAAAAYNAGPARVAQWLADDGDPRTGPIDMVDWIELIPFNETRNYVQRVVENVTIYRAQDNDTTPILTTPWTR